MRFDDPAFRDALFRQKRKKGAWRVVEAPALACATSGAAPGELVADTHAHLHMMADPAVTLACCAAHGVGFVCAITDPSEDGEVVFEHLEEWRVEAAAVLPEVLANTGRHLSEELVDEVLRSSYAAVSEACGGAACANPADGFALLPAIPRVRIAAGVHPHNAKLYDDAIDRHLRTLLHDPRVSAVGEIGLDYHYDLSPREVQREVFRLQVRLAKEAGLPVVLHVREAHDEAFAIMQEEGFPQAGTLLHCYNLDWATLEPWVREGCYVAFGGPLTFKNADEVRDAASRVPLDRLLTETDAPYMTPEPLRGTTCGPEHVVFTAAKLLEVLKGVGAGACEDAAPLAALFANACALLDREPTAWQRARC